MVTPVFVPRWGVTMEKATVVAWLADDGERVTKGQDLLEMETEKMVNVVEAPGDGVLRVILFAEGETVAVGELLAVIAEANEEFDLEAVRASSPAKERKAAATRPKREARPAEKTARGRVRASPAARRLAEEYGMELGGLAGTGPEGSVSREDVERALSDAVAQSFEDGYVDVAGMRLHYVAAGGPGTGLRECGPSVILVHGLAGSTTLWQANLTTLAARRRVIALDLPGHGLSDKPEKTYDLDFLTRAVEGFLDVSGIATAAFVGHSLGGHLCLRLALRSPTRVDRLVLVDAGGLGPEIEVGFLQPLLGGVTRGTVEFMLQGLFEDPGLVTRSMIDATMESLAQPGALRAVASGAASTVEGSRQGEVLTGQLAALPMPVLVAWGARDRVVPLNHARSAAAMIPGAELWVAETVGHCPQIEAAPSFNQRLVDFLNRPMGRGV
jgi:pyruvate dehydrogenase E2 component (dihydrolipoamide acetyltransferase)